MQSTHKNALTLIGLTGALAVFAIGNYGLGFSQWAIHWWADLAWTVASLATGVRCIRTAKCQGGQYRKAWWFFGAGCATWFAGMLAWDYQELVAHQITPFPALSDLGYLATALLWMIGMLWYRAEAPTTPITLKQVCNLGIILSAIAVAVPVILSGSFRASTGSPLYLAAAVAYPVLYGAALLFGLTCLWLYVLGVHRRVFSLILAGVAVHAATNTLYAESLLGRTYEAGNYLDVYWLIGFALIYAAAVNQSELAAHHRPASAQDRDVRRPRDVESVVSAAMLIMVTAILYLFADNLRGPLVHYVFPLSVMGIVLIGIKESWSDRVERTLQGELLSSIKALEQNEARLAGILEIAPEGIISVDARQRIVLFNKGAERIFGYSTREALGQPLDVLIPSRFQAAHQAHVDAFADSASTSRRMDERREIFARRKDGTEFPAEASLSKLALGHDMIFTVVLRDVTERKHAAECLQHRLELERTLSAVSARFVNLQADKVHDGINEALRTIGIFCRVDRSYVCLLSADRAKAGCAYEWCADGMESQREGFRAAPTAAYPWLMDRIQRAEIAHIPRVAVLPSEAVLEQRALEGAGVLSALYVPMMYAQSAVGFLGFESVREIHAWTNEDISLLKVVAEMLTNVVMRRQAEQTLEEQAIRDPLTNLYNRRYFNRRIQEEVVRAEQKGHTLAVLVCDLDHFKHLNDTQGHQAGDQILKEVAKSINESIRGADSAFRWGGDEIIVLLSKTSKDGVLVAAERIRQSVGRLRAIPDGTLDISIGIALYPEHGRTADDLVRLADRALYIAKKGGDKIHIGEEEYHLKDDTIRVVFQPVQDLRLNSPEGFEALSRDAQGKLSILDLFKKYQAIGLLEDLKALCFTTQMKTAQAVGLKKVFINADFKLLGKLQPSPVPTGLDVVLEISEGEALHDVENHLAIAAQWRACGYKFAIDDFGAGFVSLPFIARLIPEHIKLDRSTVLQAVESSRFRRILKDLLLGLRNCSTDGIIAEGIESAHELEIVKELGIYLVQGYLLGKPEALKPPSEADLPQRSGEAA